MGWGGIIQPVLLCPPFLELASERVQFLVTHSLAKTSPALLIPFDYCTSSPPSSIPGKPFLFILPKLCPPHSKNAYCRTQYFLRILLYGEQRVSPNLLVNVYQLEEI